MFRAALLPALAAVLLAACGGAQAPASPAAPSSPAQAQTQAAPSGWDGVVALAKKEGKVVVSGPASPLWRDQLTAFTKDYPEIQVEYAGGDSRDFWPKLDQERRGGQYLTDLRIGGPDPQVFDAIKGAVLDPVRPLLTQPDVADESKWLGGWDAFYADKDRRYLPGFLADVSHPIYVNRDLAPEAKLNSEQDLLDPAYKGKIVLQDPRGGAGLGFLTTFLKVDGEDFVRQLLAQQPVVSGDNRQIAEWLVRGNYPVAVGLRNYDLLLFQQQGLGKNVVPATAVKAEPLSIGSGGIQLISKRPHPNASQLFLNWLLTAKVQASLTKAVQQDSRRLDVPPGAPDEVPDPTKMSQYVAHQTEDLLLLRQQALKLATAALK